jgi:citrate lyase subunit beta/citryl-CoA lyase
MKIPGAGRYVNARPKENTPMSGPYRSMLFVPGQHGSWVPKALQAAPDAIILDLEDAVAPSAKQVARATVAASIRAYAENNRHVDMWARPNALASPEVGLDLGAVIQPGLTGLVLPKLDSRDDVLRYDALVTHFEHMNEVRPGTIEFIASLETAAGMSNCEEIAKAPRVVSLIGATARDADTSRALNFRWSPEGLETIYIRSRINLAARNAGHQYVVCGMWQDIQNLDGLRAFAALQRDLGYDGQTIIHPSHVGPVHEVYTASDEEIAFYTGMIEAFDKASANGDGSANYNGQHIDTAHVETARAIVAAARRGRN